MTGSRADSESGGAAGPGRTGDSPPSAGNPEALRAALTEAHAPVRQFLFGMCGDWHEAEDAAQESLLKAWEKRDSFHGRASPRTWIFTIARNCWLDRLRRRRSTPRQEAMDADRASASPAPPTQAARGELARAVERAVRRLPDEQREALAMRESEGMTFAEIGQALGVPPATVKSRVRYALLKLADDLKPFRRELEP